MDRRREQRARACVAALVVALVASVPAMALEGTVVDGDDQPIRGARVCYIAGNSPLLCVDSSKSGRFELPDSRVAEVRVSAKGYMRRVVSTREAAGPIKLQRAAIVFVRMTDTSTGEPLEHGEIYVIYPQGKQIGPFPVHRNGVRIRQIEAEGEIRIRTLAEGFVTPEPQALEVAADGEYEVEIGLTPK